jgi:hypothetical protein
MKHIRISGFRVLILILMGLITGCVSQTLTTTTSTTTTITTTTPVLPNVYTLPELKYILIAYYPDLFWCDPDYYPIGSAEKEQQNALDQFAAIRANSEEFSAILNHFILPDQADYTDEEKLLIYRQHKELTLGLQVIQTGNKCDFILRVGRGQGYRISGTISLSGTINILTAEESTNICPICLSRGTLIDTPTGLVTVEELRSGMPVWTLDKYGRQAETTIVRTSSTTVPNSFQMLRLKLIDGREITASPSHPSAEGKLLYEYGAGDFLDGALIASVETVFYYGSATYDILPSGLTGCYWANGILLESTLK